MASNLRAPAPYRTHHDYLLAFMANVSMTSATTVTGRQRGSQGARSGKPSAGIYGHELAEQTTSNMRAIGRFIVKVTDPASDSSTWPFRRIVNVMIDMIHRDLPNREQLKEIRRHETRKSYGCPASEVEVQWEQFLVEFERRVRNQDEDLERLCVWVEYQVRFHVHPIADGSGRLATALVAWVMLRAKRHIPMYAYVERDEMHCKLREGFEPFEAYYLDRCFRERTDGNGTSPDVPFDKRVVSDAIAS